MVSFYTSYRKALLTNDDSHCWKISNKSMRKNKACRKLFHKVITSNTIKKCTILLRYQLTYQQAHTEPTS